MSAGPAALAGLSERKGRIAEGLDADLVIWDPDARFVVEPEQLHQRHKLTPYAGRTCSGPWSPPSCAVNASGIGTGSCARMAGDCYERTVSRSGRSRV